MQMAERHNFYIRNVLVVKKVRMKYLTTVTQIIKLQGVTTNIIFQYKCRQSKRYLPSGFPNNCGSPRNVRLEYSDYSPVLVLLLIRPLLI